MAKSKYIRTAEDSWVKRTHISCFEIRLAPLINSVGQVVRDDTGRTVQGFYVRARVGVKVYPMTEVFEKKFDAFEYIREVTK